MNTKCISSVIVSASPKRNCFLTLPITLAQQLASQHMNVFVLENKDESKCYVSWSGETHSNFADGYESILVNDKLLQNFNLVPGEVVTLSQVISPVIYDTIAVRACTENDWLNISLNTEVIQLEFLNQVRVVSPDQTLPLWLAGGACVNVRVQSVTPPSDCGVLLPMVSMTVLPPATDCQGTKLDNTNVDDVCIPVVSKAKNNQSSSEEDCLIALTSVICNELLVRSTTLVTPVSPLLKLPLRVASLSSKNDYDEHNCFNNAVIISRNLLKDTYYSNKRCFLARIAAELEEDKLMQKLLFNVIIWENHKEHRNYTFNTDLTRDVEKLISSYYLIVPENLLRTCNLKQNSTIELETGRFDFCVDPRHIDVSPSVRLVSTELDQLKENIKCFFIQQCKAADYVINSNASYSFDVGCKKVECLVLLRNNKPLLINSRSANLLTIQIVELDFPLKLTNTEKKIHAGKILFVPLQNTLNNLSCYLLRALGLRSSFASHAKFAILEGGVDTGKTTLIHSLSEQLKQVPNGVHTEIVSLKCMRRKKADVLEKKLSNIASFCQLRRPSLIILDDFDSLCPFQYKDESLGDHHNQLVSVMNQFIHDMWSINVDNNYCMPGISVLVTCVNRTAIDERFIDLTSSCFGRTFSIPHLTSHDKVEALNSLLQKKLAKDVSVDDNQRVTDLHCASVYKIIEPCSLSDLHHLASRAYLLAKNQNDANRSEHQSLNIVSSEKFIKASKDYQPIGYKGVPQSLSSNKPALRVGGLVPQKRLMLESLCWPSLYPSLFTPLQGALKLLTGLLLYGPPGCGKTRLVHHITQQANINIITIKGPELLSKYIGQSEENVREVFDRARGCAPCVLFFDEFDSLAPCRGHDSTGVTDRVVNQLLTQMDGAEERRGVWVCAATCRPDLIDPALLRPGRLDRMIYLPLPSEAERKDILCELSKDYCFGDNEIKWEDISVLTPNYSGADLSTILSTAHMYALKESLGDRTSSVMLSERHIIDAVNNTRPSVSHQQLAKYELLHKKITGDGHIIEPGMRATLA